LFNVGDILKKPFGFVKDLQSLFNKQGADWDSYFQFLFSKGLSDNSIYDQSIYLVHASRLWFKERVEFINNLESSTIGHTPSGDEIAAGIDKFSIFDNYPQFRNLAGGGDYEAIERVKNWPYEFCFLEMKYQAMNRDFEKALFNIRSKKK